MGRNHQGAEDADEEIRYLTRDEAEMYAERIRAALREVGRGDLANRVTVTASEDGPECGWMPAVRDSLLGMLHCTPADDELIIRAAYISGMPDAVCVECWKVNAGCTKNFHAPDCERQEEWA